MTNVKNSELWFVYDLLHIYDDQHFYRPYLIGKICLASYYRTADHSVIVSIYSEISRNGNILARTSCIGYF
ncbi:hypothetical protein EGT86_27735 [Burkholderia pseudomallei]|nr:hypothetical protein EGT86_27735 [Burkholderia pseudomallei]